MCTSLFNVELNTPNTKSADEWVPVAFPSVLSSRAPRARIHVNNFTRWNRIKNTALGNMRVSTSKLGRFEEHHRYTNTYTVYAWLLLSVWKQFVRSVHGQEQMSLAHPTHNHSALFRSIHDDANAYTQNSASFVYECRIRYVHTATRSTIWISKKKSTQCDIDVLTCSLFLLVERRKSFRFLSNAEIPSL